MHNSNSQTATAPSEEILEGAHCVMANLHKTVRAIDRIYADEMRPAGLGRAQFSILNTLQLQGPTTVSAFAGRLNIDRTTLSRNLKPIVEEGLVKRSTSSLDARQVLLSITPMGQKRVQLARRYWRKAQKKVVALFGEHRWRNLETELGALRAVETT